MDFEEILENLNQKWQELQKKIAELIDAFNRTIEWAGEQWGDIVEGAVAFWNEQVAPKIQAVYDWFAAAIEGFGDPGALLSAADTWLMEIARPVSARAGMAKAGQLAVDDNWSGESADRYTQRLSEQEAAISAIQGQFAQPISTALREVSDAVVIWWVTIAAGLAICILGIATATGEAVTVFGIPLAPPTALGAFAAFISGLVLSQMNLRSRSISAKNSIDQATNNLTSYPGGRWPEFG